LRAALVVNASTIALFVRIVSSVFRRFVVRDINLTKTRFGGHSRSAH
jgi:hypothetical protein